MDTMAANDGSLSKASDWAAVCRPPLPVDYEMDDYWMENIVLKDEKEAEDEFYSALGRFTNQKLNPPPPYVAARIAAAPRYSPSFSLLAKSKNPHDITFPTSNTAVPPHKKKEKKKSEGEKNEKVVDPLGWMNHHPKRKRSGCAGHVCSFLSGFAAAPHKKSNQKKETDDVNVGVKNHKRKRYPTSNDSDYYYNFNGRESEVLVKKQRLILVFKKHTTTAAVPALANSVHQKQSNDVVPPVTSVSPTAISAAPRVPATNHVPVQTDHELLANLIAAKMGCCGSLTLVMTKALTRTDLEPGQNRLSIPHQQVLNDFLDCKEKASLDTDRKQKSRGCPTFEVKLLMLDQHQLQQPCNLEDDEITVHSINIANWESNSVYVLKTNWKSIVRRYQLQEGTNVQLWAFRDGQSKLCFALLRN